MVHWAYTTFLEKAMRNYHVAGKISAGAWIAFTAFGLGGALLAQPVITPKGIVNAASFVAPGLPGGAIAQGSIFSIFGNNLGPSSSPPLSFPLQTTLGGVSIKVTQGTRSVDAIPLFVSPTQINAIMPSNAPLGLVSVQVTSNRIPGGPSPIRVVRSSFGIFTATGFGIGPGIVHNVTSGTDRTLNSTVLTAAPRQTVVAWGTGLGPVSFGDNVAPSPGNLPITADILVGGKRVADADKLYFGRSPCCAGVDQIIFNVPPDAPQGCYVPLQIQTENAVTSNTVTMAVQTGGSVCTETSPLTRAFQKGEKAATILLMRANLKADNANPPVDATADLALASFRQDSGERRAFNPLFSLPPAGSCTVYTALGDLLAGALLKSSPAGRDLDAGPNLTITGPSGSRTLPRLASGSRSYTSVLGGNITLLALGALFLGPGSYSISGTGGTDVGAFTANVGVVPTVNWNNREAINTINRAQDLNITWSTGDSQIVILGTNVDVPTNSSAVFFCVVPPGANSFAIPSAVLSSLPPTRVLPRQSKSFLFLGAIASGSPNRFTAPGLDSGVAIYATLSGKPVAYQ